MSKRKKKYTETQVLGMRIVSRILKDTRESNPVSSSFRKWIDALNEALRIDRQKPFNQQVFGGVKDDFGHHAIIQRAENAGYVTKDPRRSDDIDTVNDDYLRVASKFTVYEFDYLYKIHELGVSRDINAETLDALIDNRQSAIGLENFNKLCRRFQIQKEALDSARKGIIRQNMMLPLLELLDITSSQMRDAAILQLYLEISREPLDIPEDRLIKEL